jgi:predicted N-acetyltransferase YhbS
MIEQRIYHASEFPIVLEWQVRDFVRIVWSDAHVDQPSIPLGDPKRNPINFVIVDGDMLISHAQVTTFTIEHAGETYRVAGLGGVMTYPNFRKGGYGKQLVAAVSQHIANSDVDFGMLFTSPELEGFYSQHGWIAAATETILVGDKNAPRERKEFTMMIPVSEHGQKAIKAFQGANVYVGSHGW